MVGLRRSARFFTYKRCLLCLVYYCSIYLLNNMDRSRVIYLASLAGIIGPILFALVLTVLTIAQDDFMRTLGWNPTGPVIDWPSGLALGPYGWLMTITFFVCGALMAFFAYGLKLALHE